MSIEKKELAGTVAHMRDEVTETRICMKTFTQNLTETRVSGIVEFPSDNETSTRPAGGKRRRVPTIPSLLLPEVPQAPQKPVKQKTINFGLVGHGSLSQCSEGTDTVDVIQGATGKGCVHFYIKMMEDHQGDPPGHIFDTAANKARMKKGKVKKMIDAFSSYATKKERLQLMSGDLPLDTKVIIAKGIHNKVAKYYSSEYKALGIKLNSKLTPQGSGFPNEMVVSNITEFDYQVNKARKELIELEEEEEKQTTKQPKKKRHKV